MSVKQDAAWRATGTAAVPAKMLPRSGVRRAPPRPQRHSTHPGLHSSTVSVSSPPPVPTPTPHRRQDAAIGRPQRAQPVLPQSASIHRLRALKGTQAPPARDGPSSPSPPTASAPAHLIHHLPTVPLLPLDLLANGEITAASSALGAFVPCSPEPQPSWRPRHLSAN